MTANATTLWLPFRSLTALSSMCSPYHNKRRLLTEYESYAIKSHLASLTVKTSLLKLVILAISDVPILTENGNEVLVLQAMREFERNN